MENRKVISDPYINNNNVIERLFKEWIDHGKIIIAFDYDNTVYDYDKNGSIYTKVINLLQDCHKLGSHIFCFTACDENEFPTITEYLKENDIPCDGINIDYDFIPFRGRKPYYNILLDDRAGLESSYNNLRSVCDMIYNLKKIEEGE